MRDEVQARARRRAELGRRCVQRGARQAADFQRFDNIDAARAEDRRRGEEFAAAELARQPLTAEERARFVGRWALVGSPTETLTITADGEGFKVELTEAGTTSVRAAAMLGRRLRVDEPPNYRLYELEPSGQLLLLNDTTFRYERAR